MLKLPAGADRVDPLGDASRPDPADPDTWKNNWPDHLAGAYIDSGMVNQAADFVAGRI